MVDILFNIIKIFKHDCKNHKKIISQSYIKNCETGDIHYTDAEYECNKCGNRWFE